MTGTGEEKEDCRAKMRNTGLLVGDWPETLLNVKVGKCMDTDEEEKVNTILPVKRTKSVAMTMTFLMRSSNSPWLKVVCFRPSTEKNIDAEVALHALAILRKPDDVIMDTDW